MQSDSRLLKLFRRGVEPAFDELVRRYRGALVGYAGAIAGRDHAEDVVQDSLVKAHRSLGGDEPIEPRPWLYTIVRNTALNDIRDSQKHSHDLLGEASGRATETHEVVERRQELAAVVAAVSDLPASQRKALIGHEMGGFTYEEIAAELELTTGATKQLIYRARLTLRNAVGALIPFPLIAWLVSDATGVYATGAATGAAAGGALGLSSGGATVGSAGAGGFFAGIAGAGTAKLAVVAVVAAGSVTAGVAVERHQGSSADVPSQAVASDSGTDSSNRSPGSAGSSGPLVASGMVDRGSSNASHETSGSSDKATKGPDSGGDSSEGGPPPSGAGHVPAAGDDGRTRPPTRDENTEGSDHHGSGLDESSGSDDGGSRPPRPSGDGSSGHGSGGSYGDAPPQTYEDTGHGGEEVESPEPAPAPKPVQGYESSGSGRSGSGSSGPGNYGYDD